MTFRKYIHTIIQLGSIFYVLACMYGPPDCTNVCSTKCVGGECDPELGFCQCQPGHFGPSCLPCPSWRYGRFCEDECDCDRQHSEACNATSGQCICGAGFYGDKCDSPCMTGNYGPNCSSPCPSECSILCDPVSGMCPRTDCANGFYGDQCNLPCPPGRFGPNCAKMCLDCAPYSCDPFSGKCVCPPGKTGFQCLQDCDFGYFGPDCSQQCNCTTPVLNNFASPKVANELKQLSIDVDKMASVHTYENVGCDPATGTCYCPDGTHHSPQNRRCEPCDDGFYGPDCSRQCDCPPPAPRELVPTAPPSAYLDFRTHNISYRKQQEALHQSHFQKACEPISGACLCESGYRSPNCDQPCPAGSFGLGCRKKCQCGTNGECLPSDGRCVCQSGWTGEHCEEPCPRGKFGLACNKKCDCRNGAKCDPATGTCICPTGFIGQTCDKKCPSGFFGADCKKKCNCGYSGCHHVSGICLESPSPDERNVEPKTIVVEIPGENVTEEPSTKKEKINGTAVGNSSEVVQGSGTADEVARGESAENGRRSSVARDDSRRSSAEVTDEDGQQSRERMLETMIFDAAGEGGNSRQDEQQQDAAVSLRHEPFGEKTSSGSLRKKESVVKKTVAFSNREVDVRSVKDMAEREEMILVPSSNSKDYDRLKNNRCPSPFYGPGCQSVCQCQANGTCDHKGQCRCRPGYIGPLCEHKCPPNYYGHDCTKRCRCMHMHTGSRCNHENGACDCAAGFTGRHCGRQCPSGNFGRNCGENCASANCHPEGSSGCDRITGACICKGGYTGSTCAEACPTGTYGPRCGLECLCKNGGVCDPKTGSCECVQPGYIGPLCEHECDTGYWGANCNESCSPACRSGLCKRDDGLCINPVSNTPYRRRGNRRRLGPNNAALTGPAETSQSSEARRPRHYSPGSGGRSIPSSPRSKRCPPFYYGPDCSLPCSSCIPPPHSRNCDRKNGRCRCNKNWMGPYCERPINGDFGAGRADVAPSSFLRQFDEQSSLSSSTEQLLQEFG